MTHKQRVLQLLKDGKPHNHHELYQLGCVAHSRISDLRRDGHTIEAWRDGDLYLYRLVLNEAAPAQRAAPPCLSAASLSPPASNPTLAADGAGVLSLFEATA